MWCAVVCCGVLWCAVRVRVVVVVMILLAGGRRALDERGTKYSTDSLNESWFQIGSFGGGEGGRAKEKRKPEAEK
jgi:hypothetical protein